MLWTQPILLLFCTIDSPDLLHPSPPSQCLCSVSSYCRLQFFEFAPITSPPWLHSQVWPSLWDQVQFACQCPSQNLLPPRAPLQHFLCWCVCPSHGYFTVLFVKNNFAFYASISIPLTSRLLVLIQELKLWNHNWSHLLLVSIVSGGRLFLVVDLYLK